MTKLALSLLTAFLVTLGHAETYEIVSALSEARYRVREQLANVSLPNDAVGVTSAVSGTVLFDESGNVLSDSQIVVDLSTLQSDQNRRDGFIKRETLQTDTFPNAVFVPTELRGLEFPLPESGTANFEILGNLTIRDVTREVVWQAEAEFDGDTVAVEATTGFTFDDFSLTQPRVFLVLSIEDTIGLEVDFTLQRLAE